MFGRLRCNRTYVRIKLSTDKTCRPVGSGDMENNTCFYCENEELNAEACELDPFRPMCDECWNDRIQQFE